MAETDQNIYGKLLDARAEFHKLELKKTGENKHAGFKYFELSDFLKPAMDCLNKQGLIPIVTFSLDTATMIVYDRQSEDTIVVQSPMVSALYEDMWTDDRGIAHKLEVAQGANLRGCHPIQNMGAVETYQRRYLWVALMEVVESDILDSVVGQKETPAPARQAAPVKRLRSELPKKPEQPAPAPDPASAPAPEDKSQAQVGWGDAGPAPVFPDADTPFFADEAGAKEVADLIISLADMHGDSPASVMGFWEKNRKPIDALDTKFPEQYARVKAKFTELKQRLKAKQEQQNG